MFSKVGIIGIVGIFITVIKKRKATMFVIVMVVRIIITKGIRLRQVATKGITAKRVMA